MFLIQIILQAKKEEEERERRERREQRAVDRWINLDKFKLYLLQNLIQMSLKQQAPGSCRVDLDLNKFGFEFKL